MRAVVTRVKSASVTIDGRVNGEIGQGLLVLLGVGPSDTEAQAVKLADKVCGLRIFEDENEKMNLNLEAVGGALLVVSQFTLYADTKSRRPGFTGAAKPALAVPLYERFMAECEKLGGCKTGEAKITKGYKLNAKYVIHTPGPIWRGGGKGEDELLASCYKNCLKLAVENNIKTIAFPSISTGVYRFPVEQAAEIAVNEILGFLYEHDEIDSVTMVCYDENTYKVYKKAYENALKK